MESLLLTFASCLVAIFLVIEFFIKKRINTDETKIYSKLLVINLLFSVFAIFAYVYAKNIGSVNGINFTQKIYLFLIIVLAHFILKYNVSIAIRNTEYKNKITKQLNLLLIVSGLLIFSTKINVINEGLILDASGISYNIFMTSLIVYVLIIMISTIYIFKNNKDNRKKDIPFIILLILYIIGFVLRGYFPYVVFETFFFTYSLLIMYFTIENPDVKMLQEYIKNKELVESNIEEKSNILFKISQEVRVPLKKINYLSNNIAKSENVSEIHEDARNIGNISDDATRIVNDVLDISDIDKRHIKIIAATYNIYNLFNQIIYFGKENKKNIDFKYSISNVIPEKLYGDSSRLKQIICSVLNNAFKHTEEGFVDLDIFSIVKYDICRLVITISDTGKGMSLDFINSILEDTSEINEEQIDRLNNLDIDFKTIKKLIYLQGGSLLINSNNNGTKCTIVIDQIINDETKQNYIELISEKLSNKKKVLLINDDYKELELYAKELKKNGLEVVSTMHGKDCIDRLCNKEKFDYIFIDDEMDKYNAVTTIKEINKLNVNNSKIIIMLDKDKESIKEHYLDDYQFSDYLIKRIYKDEIIRIIKKNEKK